MFSNKPIKKINMGCGCKKNTPPPPPPQPASQETPSTQQNTNSRLRASLQESVKSQVLKYYKKK